MVAEAKPCRSLGDEGQRLWNDVVADYPINNPAAAELLLLTCESVDRLTELRAERKAAASNAADSRVLGRLDKDITAVCSLIASLLVKLDKYVAKKPRRLPGRPPTNIHWTPNHALD